jgi:hypothetical protein
MPALTVMAASILAIILLHQAGERLTQLPNNGGGLMYDPLIHEDAWLLRYEGSWRKIEGRII